MASDAFVKVSNRVHLGLLALSGGKVRAQTSERPPHPRVVPGDGAAG
jgi:hypothetical protein